MPASRKWLYLFVALLATLRQTKLLANPTGMTIGAGSATAQQLGSQLNITVSQTAILNWQGFNIGVGETTSFLQPSANSVVLNVIGGQNPSQIFGNLNANGTVILENANGFYFGPNSMISVGGSFIATTAPLAPDLGSGAGWQFTGMPPLASIVNYGQIEVGTGRSLFLIAEKIENHGSLNAPQGDVGLLAGDTVLVSERPDGRGLSATTLLPQGSVDNFGRITAAAGTIALNAKVVNQDGILQADSIAQKNGVIELVASDSLNLGADSQILARGDDSASGSPGGTVTLKSDNSFSDSAGSSILTTGGANGGNGGNVEVSAPNIMSLDSSMNASASASYLGGNLWLDPINIVLKGAGATTTTPDSSGTINGSGATSSTWNVNVNTAFLNKNFSQILLEASGNLTVSAGLTWNLSASTGETDGRLILEAHGNIIFGNNSMITDANNWSMTLLAGVAFPAGTVAAGSGNIYLNGSNGGSGSGSIQAGAGAINLSAGNTIQLASGSIQTTAGGNIFINAGNGFSDSSGLIETANGGGITLNYGSANIDLNSIYSHLVSPAITLETSGGITLGTTWDLSGGTGLDSGLLTLLAGGDIVFGNSAQITDANNWSVTLEAGYNISSGAVQSGNGSIYLNGGSGLSQNGTIQLAAGSINLIAGQSILVGSGSVYTTGGGSIFADALSGDINAGTANGSSDGTQQSTGFSFSDSGWTPNPYLGGISTAAGGNVTLIAGNNIDSTPTVPSQQAPGASGAYGFGDVTVIAGNQITGNYLVTAGSGRMLAGVPVSTAQAVALQNPAADPAAYATTLSDLVTAVEQSHNSGGNLGTAPVNGNPSTAPVTLGLTSGSWNVWAANNVSILQVINPNGAFNDSQSFAYNYAPDAAVSLWAGNAIELVGGSYGSVASSVRVTPIYAPILSLNAGAGGIKLDKNVILAPSSEGSLSIVTRDGGDLSGAVVAGSTVLNSIIMSDSASGVYTTFASEHDNIHLNDPHVENDPNFKPVYLDISGSIGSFSLTMPTFADITVEGTKPFVNPDGNNIYGTYNFGFKGRNLSAGQTTSINVLGAITYRGDLTAISLTAAQLADLLPPALFAESAAPNITAKLRYDATTGRLIYVGVMSPDELAFLQNPSVIVPGQFVTQLDANGNPQPVPVTAPLPLDATQKAMILQLYSASLSATLGDQGLALAGPGNFNVTANSIDLGVSGGIRVIAPDAGLAAISPYGANLNVTTLGDLSMTSTKISNESYRGGVNVNVGGTLDVGGQFTTLGDPSAPKGIFTTSGGNVSVTANANVNVDGSRIAAYDGGNVTVTSENGDVNAGAGGAGYVTLSALQLNSSGQLTGIPARIPGSGILATTVVGSDALLGDITIGALNGNINASLGGVLQIGFDGHGPADAFISANAGHDINATGSGIIGSNIRLQAGGNVNGLVIGGRSVNINALENVNVTAVSGGSVNIAASGTVSGTIVGGGDVSVSGDSIDAAIRGGSVSASGNTSAASIGVPASNVTKETAQMADNANAITSKTGSDNTDDEDSKKKKRIALAQKISRVTVLLPQKN